MQMTRAYSLEAYSRTKNIENLIAVMLGMVGHVILTDQSRLRWVRRLMEIINFRDTIFMMRGIAS